MLKICKLKKKSINLIMIILTYYQKKIISYFSNNINLIDAFYKSIFNYWAFSVSILR